MITQTEGRTLGLVALANVGGAVAYLDGVQGAVVLTVIGTAVDGTLDVLVDSIHAVLLLDVAHSVSGTETVCPGIYKVFARLHRKQCLSINCTEVIDLDLKNNQITVRELMANPKAKALFQKRFGEWMKHPLFSAAQSLTLSQLMELAKVYLPQKIIQSTLEELKRL